MGIRAHGNSLTRWWHRWRANVWERRYLMARGMMETLKLKHGNAACEMLEFYDAHTDSCTAASAVMFHRERAAL